MQTVNVKVDCFIFDKLVTMEIIYKIVGDFSCKVGIVLFRKIVG